MSNTSQAVEALKRFAVQFQGIAEVGAALENIGSLEGAAKSAQAQLDKARGDLAQANEQLTAAQAGVNAAKETAADILAQAGEDAELIRFNANAGAANKALAARAEIDADRAQAKAQADAARNADKQARETAAADLAAVNNQTLFAIAKRDAAQAELDELNGKIAAAREAVAKLLG